MKKAIFSALCAVMVCACANASDGGYYTETETYTNNVSFNFETVTYSDAPYQAAQRPARPCAGRVASSADLARPCPAHVGNPVRVKTYTEVIDHYQVYQPVVTYVPAGTYSARRVIEHTPEKCIRCGL